MALTRVIKEGTTGQLLEGALLTSGQALIRQIGVLVADLDRVENPEPSSSRLALVQALEDLNYQTFGLYRAIKAGQADLLLPGQEVTYRQAFRTGIQEASEVLDQAIRPVLAGLQ